MNLLKITTGLFLLLSPLLSSAQSLAWQRANKMGKGINLSWMDQRWNGSEAEDHRDYLDLDELPYIKDQIKLMHELGFQLLRFPVCFELWYDNEAPYKLLKPEYYPALDSVIKWTAEKKMQLIIDNHHGTLNTTHLSSDTKRICAIWNDVARRYKNSDAERLFFEIFNEPHQISQADWEQTAEEIIATIRKQAPYHTLIAGASEWNGRKALQNTAPFADTNIIYTFHFYDPFLYTHQGASWAGDAASTTGLPYPYRSEAMPIIDTKAAVTWAKGAFQQYPSEATYESLDNKLNSIKEWAEDNNVPFFCGEWGAYKKHTPVKDRCNYLHDVYTILQHLKIPNAMWEWDAGFSFFEDKPSIDGITPCMKGIVSEK
jgi:endoglucanase